MSGKRCPCCGNELIKPEVVTIGETVSVYDDHGRCVGHFSRMGIVTEKPLTAALKCLHSVPTPQDWDVFRRGMSRLYGVTVPPELMPGFLGADRPTKVMRTPPRDMSVT